MQNMTTLNEWSLSLSQANTDITFEDLKIMFVADFLEGNEMLSPYADTTNESNTEIWVISDDPVAENIKRAYGQNRLCLAQRLISYGCIVTNHSHEEMRASIRDAISGSASMEPNCELRNSRHDKFREHMEDLSEVVGKGRLTNSFEELCQEIVFTTSMGIRFAMNRELKLPAQISRDIIRAIDASRNSGRKPKQRSYARDCEGYLRNIIKYDLYDVKTDNKAGAARMIKRIFNPPIDQGAIINGIKILHEELLDRL